jgi:hypothetical protein
MKRAFFGLVILFMASLGATQTVEHVATYLNYSWESDGYPGTHMLASSQHWLFEGGEYILHSDGNGWLIVDISGGYADAPETVAADKVVCAASQCPLQNDGDMDHQLVGGIAICDHCKFGFAAGGSEGIAMWRWELIYGKPKAVEKTLLPSYTSDGIATYLHSGSQYMITNGLPGGCATATLYRVNDPGDLTLVECVSGDFGGRIVVNRGVLIDENYFGILTSVGEFNVFSISDSGLEYIDTAIDTVTRPSYSKNLQRVGQCIAFPRGIEGTILDFTDPINPLTDDRSGIPGQFIGLVSGSKGSALYASQAAGKWTSDSVEISGDFWSPENQWNQPKRRRLLDAAWVGNRVYVARDSIAFVARFVPGKTNEIFSDGFESGNTCAWN